MRRRHLVHVFLVGLGLLFALPAAGAFGQDIQDVEYNATTGTYYKRYDSIVTWSAANQAATALGGHLVTITSASENAFIVNNLNLPADVWIGATDQTTEGTWVWVTGEAWSYTNWGANEPNNSGNEDYGSIRSDGLWNDLRATHTRRYIVEWEEDPNGPPTAPTDLVAVAASEARADLTWSDNSTRETGYEIERSTASGPFVQIATRGANTQAFPDTTVTAETAYSYRVRAVGSGGNSEYTNVASIVTPSPPVANLVGTPLSSTTVALSWTDTATLETGFRVERGSGDPATTFSTLATLLPDASEYTDTTASPERTYTYRVRALGPDGSPSSSPTAVVTTFPGPPDFFAASTPDGPFVFLEWQSSSTTSTHFDIDRRTTSPLSEWTSLATAGALFREYDDATVAAETEYEYRIRNVTTSGASEWTAAVRITTPPHAPSDVVGESLSTNHVRLTWTDLSGTETKFAIMRAVAPDGLFEDLATVPRNATSYDDTSVSQEGAYVYRVAAIWGLGQSEWVETEQTVVLPSALSVDSFVIKPGKTKKGKVKPGRVDVRGAFDTGETAVALTGAATIEIGGTVIGVTSLTPKGKTLRHIVDGVRLIVTPDKGSSRVSFSLRLTGAVADELDPDGEVALRYTLEGFAAQGTVQLQSGRFQPAKSGRVVAPPLDVTSLSVRVANGDRDRLKAKGAFDASAGAPDVAPTVTVELGVLSFTTYPTHFSRKGDRWTYSEKDGKSKRKMVLDYATGLLTISMSNIDVGPFERGSAPVTVTVRVDDIVFEDTPVLVLNGASMGY